MRAGIHRRTILKARTFGGLSLLKDEKLAALAALSLLERRMKNLILLQKGKKKGKV